MVTADTHIFIWNALKPDLLSSKARASMDRANETDSGIINESSSGNKSRSG